MVPTVSVLQLDTAFPRVPGDVGCPETYCESVEIIRIAGATVGAIVSDRPDLINIAPFEEGLCKATGNLVVTSCGFLSYWQEHLAALSDKVFISSALIALDHLSQTYEAGEVMILTFDDTKLTPEHLGRHAKFAAGIVGLPKDMHLRQVISGNQKTMDIKKAAKELASFVAASLRPHHKHLLLECTNLSPYKRSMQNLTKIPISDILTLIEANQPKSIQPQFLTKEVSK